jgi:hypothetical protein
MNSKSYIAISIALVLTQGCGSSDSKDTVKPEQKPVFSLSVSDAPVEDALQVVVCFNTVELKAVDSANNQTFVIGSNGNAAATNDLCATSEGVVEPNTRGIDLLSLSGIKAEQIFSDIEIAAGNYSQVRLTISDKSYVLVDLDKDGLADDNDNDGIADKLPLKVPSNELKLDGFTATQGQQVDLTVEFDLRKGMTNPVGQAGYILKPRGVRIVDNSVLGHIQGTVTETLLLDNQCAVAPANLMSSVATVYLYEGISLDPTTLADNGGSEGQEPLTSTAVLYDGAGNYNFEIGYVKTASYTLALSCDEDIDPEGDDAVSFINILEANVADKGQITKVNFGG